MKVSNFAQFLENIIWCCLKGVGVVESRNSDDLFEKFKSGYDEFLTELKVIGKYTLVDS